MSPRNREKLLALYNELHGREEILETSTKQQWYKSTSQESTRALRKLQTHSALKHYP